jgi:hypothetical protein
MLPNSANRVSVSEALATLGKVLRVRIAREAVQFGCKGYGYAWIELQGPVSSFIQGCMHLEIPILAFPIQAPKYLGSENTLMLRRYLRLEHLDGSLTALDTMCYLQSLGPIEFMAAEVDKDRSERLFRVHALFRHESSLANLTAIKKHYINNRPVTVKSFIGLQEYPFAVAPNSKTTVLFGSYSEKGTCDDPFWCSSGDLPKVTVKDNRQVRDYKKNSRQGCEQPCRARQPYNQQDPGITNAKSKIESYLPPRKVRGMRMIARGFPQITSAGVSGGNKESQSFAANKKSAESPAKRCSYGRLVSVPDHRHIADNLKFNLPRKRI